MVKHKSRKSINIYILGRREYCLYNTVLSPKLNVAVIPATTQVTTPTELNLVQVTVDVYTYIYPLQCSALARLRFLMEQSKSWKQKQLNRILATLFFYFFHSFKLGSEI